MKYRKEYKMTFPYGTRPHHCWSIVGRHGAKHLHINGYDAMNSRIEFCGGLETHWRVPPEYMANQAPSQDKCWLLNQPCWHDGTSLYVSESIIPMIEGSLRGIDGLTANDHAMIFKLLENHMEETFPETNKEQDNVQRD